MAIILGVSVGWLSGGRLGRIAQVEFPGAGILFLCFALQGLARGRLGNAAHDLGLIVWGAASVTIVVLLAWVVRWRDVAAALPPAVKMPLGLVAVATMMNLIVVFANGSMPVEATTTAASGAARHSAGFYTLVNDGTIGPALADVLQLTAMKGTYFLSAGDVILGVAVVLFVAAAMLGATPSQSG